LHVVCCTLSVARFLRHVVCCMLVSAACSGLPLCCKCVRERQCERVRASRLGRVEAAGEGAYGAVYVCVCMSACLRACVAWGSEWGGGGVVCLPFLWPCLARCDPRAASTRHSGRRTAMPRATGTRTNADGCSAGATVTDAACARAQPCRLRTGTVQQTPRVAQRTTCNNRPPACEQCRPQNTCNGQLATDNMQQACNRPARGQMAGNGKRQRTIQ
jgi:hypothetical protein